MPLVLHDYITQRGGAERVALLLAQHFGEGRLTTSAFDAANSHVGFADIEVTELVPRAPAAMKRSRASLAPLAAGAFLRHKAEADLVLCSSSGWAHWTSSPSPSVVYCYTPPRWFWEPRDYLTGQPRWLQETGARASHMMRRVDVARARRRSRYVAISTVARDRIRRAYNIDAEIVSPPVTLEAEGPTEPVPGLEPGFFLTIARARSYKNIEAAVHAFEANPGIGRLVVVGSSPPPERPNGGSVLRLGRVSDAQLRWLYRHSLAVVALSFEDFGLTPVEGHLFGKPTVALQAGGYLDTCSEDLNAVWVQELSPSAVAAALRRAAAQHWSAPDITAGAECYRPETFLRKLGDVMHDVRATA